MLLALIIFVIGLAVGAGAIALIASVRRENARMDAEVEAILEESSLDVEEGEVLDLEPVDVRSTFIGLVQMWRRQAKERRLAENGYVKWFRLDSQLQSPSWVKPVQSDGRGIGKVTTGEGPYYFSRDAMVTDARTGAWVSLHEVGDADPVNLRDTAFPGIPVDRVEELLDMEVEADKPGFFENLDISASTAFIAITVVLFLVYAAMQVM